MMKRRRRNGLDFFGEQKTRSGHVGDVTDLNQPMYSRSVSRQPLCNLRVFFEKENRALPLDHALA